jgi:hypothetical protein
MVQRRIRLVLALVGTMASMAMGQQLQVVTQTPRQAVIELLTGDQAAAKSHLTVEVQKQIAASGNSNASLGGMSLLGMMNMAKGTGGPEFQVFETGPILFSVDNQKDRQKIELRVESNVVRGETADLDLSLHTFKDGIEESLPVGFRILLGLKQQQGIWRLNAITFSAKLPIGDPRLFDPATWNRTMMAGRAIGVGGGDFGASNVPEKIPIARAVKMVGMAENVYSKKHPGAGFTCNLADLVNVGKGFDNGEPYTYLDPEFATGVYNGYRFTLSSCAGSPAASFQVVAEPVKGSGKAYCSDASNTLRTSDDGHGATCLVSGRVTMR